MVANNVILRSPSLGSDRDLSTSSPVCKHKLLRGKPFMSCFCVLRCARAHTINLRLHAKQFRFNWIGRKFQLFSLVLHWFLMVVVFCMCQPTIANRIWQTVYVESYRSLATSRHPISYHHIQSWCGSWGDPIYDHQTFSFAWIWAWITISLFFLVFIVLLNFNCHTITTRNFVSLFLK